MHFGYSFKKFWRGRVFQAKRTNLHPKKKIPCSFNSSQGEWEWSEPCHPKNLPKSNITPAGKISLHNLQVRHGIALTNTDKSVSVWIWDEEYFMKVCQVLNHVKAWSMNCANSRRHLDKLRVVQKLHEIDEGKAGIARSLMEFWKNAMSKWYCFIYFESFIVNVLITLLAFFSLMIMI